MGKILPREKWHKIKPDDLGEQNCPFCDMESEKEDYILWIGKFFHIRHNKYPYLGLKNHLLAIPNRHIFKSYDLSREELLELKEVEEFMKDYYKGGDYFSFLRETTGSKSLNHLHYHFLPGKIYDNDIENMLKKQGFGKKL